MSAVNKAFKKKVHETGVVHWKYWREWTKEERRQTLAARKGKGKGKWGNSGYEPQIILRGQATQYRTTNTDPWTSWDTPVQSWGPSPPLEPPPPPAVVAFIARQHQPPPPVEPPPPLEHQDQPEKKDEDSSSCRNDENFEQFVSRLAALAVAFDDREEENADDVGFFDVLD